MTHQTVDDAETGVGRRRGCPDASRRPPLGRRSRGWTGIGGIHDAQGAGHDGVTHAGMHHSGGHRLPRENELSAHEGGRIAHIFRHSGDGDRLLRLSRRLLLRQAGRRRRQRESLRRRKGRKLELADQEGGSRGGSRGGRR